jgi:hypothetical protein
MTDDRKPKSSIDEETKQILIDCLKDTPMITVTDSIK